MQLFRGHLILALWVLVGSAIPFVPTGEMVTGAAAYATHSKLSAVVIFAITFTASVLGDLVMIAYVRLSSRRLQPWLKRRKFGRKVTDAEGAVTRHALNAIVTGRLIPGGRTPIIFALGLARYPVRRFLAYDAVACAIWAAIYCLIGTIGGRATDQPWKAVAIAIGIAVTLSLLIEGVRRWRSRRASRSQKQEDGVGESNLEPADLA